RSGGRLLAPEVLLHLRVLLCVQQLPRFLVGLLSFAVVPVGLDEVAHAGQPAGDLGDLLVVGYHLGSRQLGLQLRDVAGARLHPIDHAAGCPRGDVPPTPCSSPSRAALKAATATSSMSSLGSRVVNFWVPSTGSSSTLTTGS